MVNVDVIYEGQLHCSATHEPSGNTIVTDAPKDNMGKGEAFSPTDLVATALGTCMLTTMGIAARRLNVDVSGATVRVSKEMVSQPLRRIGRLTVALRVPEPADESHRAALERAALTCPVHKSLHPDVEIPVTIEWFSR